MENEKLEMKKHIAIKLRERAEDVAFMFSMPDRKQNITEESFTLSDIKPLSDATAVVTYLKNTGKKACAFFYYLYTYDKWNYFFPTDSHILGMEKFGETKLDVESQNYPLNL